MINYLKKNSYFFSYKKIFNKRSKKWNIPILIIASLILLLMFTMQISLMVCIKKLNKK